MTTSRLRQLASIASLLLVVASIVPVRSAYAQDPLTCITEESIFWGYQSGGQFRQQYGTKSDHTVRNRGVNAACDGANAGSTSNNFLGTYQGNWIEGGWFIWKDSPTAPKEYHWFVEAAINGALLINPVPHGELTSKCDKAVGDGTALQFKVAHFPIGSTDWIVDLNCLDGQGWQNLRTLDNLGWYTGLSMVETFRFGGTLTGMADDQDNIQRKDSSNVWRNWADMSCHSDNASNWHGGYISTDHYKTTKSTLNYCPGPV